jgi:acyl carrier protein
MNTIEVIMEGISASIREFLLRELLTGEDRRELTERTPLITGGILDSISTLKLVIFLEGHFGIDRSPRGLHRSPGHHRADRRAGGREELTRPCEEESRC